MHHSHIAISGELGSGKSIVAEAVAKALTANVISTGALQRELAESKGVTTLELNRQAERDSRIDRDLDELLVRRGHEETTLVFDSRMAWHFVPTSLKVHLVVSPEVGAARIAGSRTAATESYETVQEAQRSIEDRATSERQRFLSKYGVDIARLRNYDVVIDTSNATPDEVVAKILEEVATPPREQSLWVSPRRIIPTGNSVRLIGDSHRVGYVRNPYLLVCFSRPHFFVVRDYSALSAALDQRLTLVGAGLEAEAGEPIVGKLTADNYIRSETRLSWIYDWEDAHNFRFSSYPAYLRQ